MAPEFLNRLRAADIAEKLLKNPERLEEIGRSYQDFTAHKQFALQAKTVLTAWLAEIIGDPVLAEVLPEPPEEVKP